MTSRAVSATFVGLLAGVVALAAQSPRSSSGAQTPRAPTFRSTTHLVRVDASVTDADGRPVSGLTASDFTLLDRGRPQTIAAFEEVHHDPPTSSMVGHRDVASNLIDNKSELMVLVLDDEHIRKEWTAHAREIVGDFVRDLDEDALIAMISTSGKYNVELTNDRQRILDALATFSGQEVRLAYKAPGGHEGPPSPPTSAGFSAQDIKNLHLQGTPAAGGSGPPAPVSSAGGGTCGGAKGHLEGVPYDTATLSALLGSAAKILGSDEARHKALGWISTGDAFGGVDRGALDQMKRSGVATYAIDPVGTGDVIAGGAHESGGCSHFTADGTWLQVVDDRTPWQAAADSRKRSLTSTAKLSGGEAIVNDDDFAAGVKRLAADFGTYYTLGFYPDDATTPGARPLSVTVDRPGMTVHARLTYSLTNVADLPVSKALPTLVSGLAPNSDLPMRLYTATLPPTAGRNGGRVVVTLEVTEPAAALAETDGELRDALTYGVFAVSLGNGKIAQQTAKKAELSLRPSTDGGSPDVTYSVETSLLLPSGRYQIRASAMSAKMASGGSVYALLDMPDYSKSVLALSDVVVGDSSVPVARTSDPRSAATLATLTFAPTLSRTFRAGDPMHVYAEIASRAGATAVTADVALVAGDGRVVWHNAHALTATDAWRLDARFPVPPLPAGPYALRVSAEAGTNHVSRDIAIVIK